MEGINPLLKTISTKFFKTMGLNESGTDKNRFPKVFHISLGLECNWCKLILKIHKSHLYHHQIHQIEIHQHLQTKTHFKLLTDTFE